MCSCSTIGDLDRVVKLAKQAWYPIQMSEMSQIGSRSVAEKTPAGRTRP